MSSWRRRLVNVLADELGTARGEARALAERASAAADAARATAETVLADTDRKRASLTAIHERMLATIDRTKE
jgi:DNA segregation ATPase FtsK/SpoIIIE, S-DNA-T family